VEAVRRKKVRAYLYAMQRGCEYRQQDDHGKQGDYSDYYPKTTVKGMVDVEVELVKILPQTVRKPFEMGYGPQSVWMHKAPDLRYLVYRYKRYNFQIALRRERPVLYRV
jgi:hypothetical protein